MTIISQCILLSKHQGIHFEYIQFLLVSYISVKLKKKMYCCNLSNSPVISDLCRCSEKREGLLTQQPSVYLITQRILRWEDNDTSVTREAQNPSLETISEILICSLMIRNRIILIEIQCVYTASWQNSIERGLEVSFKIKRSLTLQPNILSLDF